MPGIGGPALAERFARRPTRASSSCRATRRRLAHHGLADDAASFLAKPFTQDLLARRVRDALTGETTRETVDARQLPWTGPR